MVAQKIFPEFKGYSELNDLAVDYMCSGLVLLEELTLPEVSHVTTEGLRQASFFGDSPTNSIPGFSFEQSFSPLHSLETPPC